MNALDIIVLAIFFSMCILAIIFLILAIFCTSKLFFFIIFFLLVFCLFLFKKEFYRTFLIFKKDKDK
ncbi:hypothetical protein BSN82_07945 [Acinetobacter baylyi]|nr:hypothetical protein BSL88_00910 [Acinetobacter baylyi]MAK29070.1 hypothetical protein [Acinetobacter sp.]KAF2374356.1 hypothetical protein BSL67_07010 [Acinetobacter baylyi]KAF2378747.1 hypothetical protein BSN81_01010 [Acinetobacter baylyi]KAF2381061.1 hypothetical protein BSN83_07995 [Acinetobacter baylyi]